MTDEKPERKAVVLGPDALRDLASTSAGRCTEREAMEEALSLLAARDAQLGSMREFVDWARAEWGEPTPDERAMADEIWNAR